MIPWIKDNVKLAVKSPPASWLWEKLGVSNSARANHEIYGVQFPAEVVVYFGDVSNKTYQLEQWLPIFEELNREIPVLLVFRKLSAIRVIKDRTHLPMVLVRRFQDLVSLYDENEFKLAIYVNNGMTNFQSLNHARMVHVHVNHGESDKLSMVSNQAKAYDRVMVAGPAAIERHRTVLMDFNEDRLMPVGRPQLDIEFPSELARSPRRTIMYAPTWEGENESNNYTSLDLFGVKVVEELLATPNVRVVYKPHPRILNSSVPEMAEANQTILGLLNQANENHGVDHVFSPDGNILAMFAHVDALITDVSSVGLDFLYLHPERPVILTDRRDDHVQLIRDAPIASACPVVRQSNVDAVGKLIRDYIDDDYNTDERMKLRAFYFGNHAKGDSTAAFITGIRELVKVRTDTLQTRSFHASSMESLDD